jgi:hypothetical protein
MLSKSQHILIIACLIGLFIMFIEHQTHDKRVIAFLAIPIALMLIAKRILKKEIDE